MLFWLYGFLPHEKRLIAAPTFVMEQHEHTERLKVSKTQRFAGPYRDFE
jgi:hypothetical protein